MNHLNSALLGPVFAFLSSCTWAIGCTNYSRLSEEFSGFRINFTRALISLPFFLACALIGGGTEIFRTLDFTHVKWLSGSVLSSYAIGDLLFMLSTRSLGAPGGMAIASSYPILTALISILFLHQPLTALKVVGLTAAIAGIILVILNDPKPGKARASLEASQVFPEQALPENSAEASVSGKNLEIPLLKKKWVGVLLAVLAAACWSVNSLSVAEGGKGLDAMLANAVRMTLALIMIGILGTLSQRKFPKPLPYRTIKSFFWVFFAESFLGAFFFLYGLSRTGSLVLGSILSSLAPVIAVPVALILGHEQPSWIRSFAVFLVVAGVSALIL